MRNVISFVFALLITASLSVLSERPDHSANFRDKNHQSNPHNMRNHDEFRSKDHFRRNEGFRFREHHDRRNHGRFYHHYKNQIFIPGLPVYPTDCCYWEGGVCGCNKGATVCCNGEVIADCSCY